MVEQRNPNEDTDNICAGIIRELEEKQVHWIAIKNSLLTLLARGKTLTTPQYAIVSTLQIAQIGLQLDRIENKLNRKSIPHTK